MAQVSIKTDPHMRGSNTLRALQWSRVRGDPALGMEGRSWQRNR
jgi:hypothetical protein